MIQAYFNRDVSERSNSHDRRLCTSLLRPLFLTHLPASCIFAFVAPVVGRSFLQNQINISQVFIVSVSGPGLMVGIVSAILYTLGPVYLGVAVRRSNDLPKWAGAFFAVHGALLSFGFAFFPALILGWILFTISGGWIFWSARKQRLSKTISPKV